MYFTKSYVYVVETKLYYLQSRYYDPTIGRFINADAYTSTGQGILGNNMFAYCGNNPVNYIDPAGSYYRSPHAEIDALFYEGIGGGHCPGGGGLSQFVDHLTNEDETVVIEAEGIAFYKGVPVIRRNTENADSFSFGAIFLGGAVDVDDVDLLRHEYGHVLQLRELGLKGYILYVAVPSAYYFNKTKKEKYSWDVYYDRPWEYIADVYGEATRTHSPYAQSVAEVYWTIVKIINFLF